MESHDPVFCATKNELLTEDDQDYLQCVVDGEFALLDELRKVEDAEKVETV